MDNSHGEFRLGPEHAAEAPDDIDDEQALIPEDGEVVATDTDEVVAAALEAGSAEVAGAESSILGARDFDTLALPRAPVAGRPVRGDGEKAKFVRHSQTRLLCMTSAMPASSSEASARAARWP